MMKSIWLLTAVFLGFLCLNLTYSAPLYAQEEAAQEEAVNDEAASQEEGASEKKGRWAGQVNALERASSGFTNILYGPLELPYQMKNEIARRDPIRGFIPGLVKGLTWMIAREVVGIVELCTFFAPHQPMLKEFDTDWLYA